MTASPETKNDIILGAFSQLRISGITIIPSPSQQSLALRRLENTIAELHDIWNIAISYNFEDDPDFGSPHNLPRGLYDAVEVILAYRLAPDFGKQIPIEFSTRVRGAMRTLFKATATASRVDYPSRMPKGKLQTAELYQNTDKAPIDSSVIVMYNGERDEFIESFITEFNNTEVISSFTIEVDDELTINSSSNDDYSVTVDITATGNSDGSASVPKLKITVTTDENKIITRIITFSLLDSEI